jgi:hypothetical protein
MNIKSFFSSSKTVWVSENFKSIFLERYAPSAGQHDGSVGFSGLEGMKATVGELVFQDADIFLEELARLIQEQLNGEEGKLLNDSSANYFFLKAKDGKHYSILVRWEQAQKLWRCGAYLQEELNMPNIRIFYPK